MDEEFILVSKNKIKEYEAKIKELEFQLNSPQSSVDKDFVEQSLEKFSQSIENKLNTLVSDSIQNSEVSNLDLKNIILENRTADNSQYEEIVKNLRLLVEHLEDTSHLKEISESILEIKHQFVQSSSQGIAESEKESESELNQIQILEKLQEIELFMSNLRILLSYVKPKNLERER